MRLILINKLIEPIGYFVNSVGRAPQFDFLPRATAPGLTVSLLMTS